MVIAVDTSKDRLGVVRDLVDLRLDQLVARSDSGDSLNRAIREALLAPGKRLRPSLAILMADELGAVGSIALDPACAIEMVHTASLVVDDLPCMDNADLRRGAQTSHVSFGVETALLASISLLNRAPWVLSRASGLEASVRLQLIDSLSSAVGDCCGLTAGQMKDLQAVRGAIGLDELETIAREKTAGLFVCAAEIGARVAGADRATIDLARRFAGRLGTSFQILDDVADLEATSEDLGKDVRKDRDKSTYATVLGAERARRQARRLTEEAFEALDQMGLGHSTVATLADTTLTSLESRAVRC